MELKVIDNTEKLKKEKPKTHFDYTLLILVMMLIGIGLIMVASSSSYTAVKYEVESTYYLKKQALFAGIGLGIMLFFGRVDYKILKIRIFKLPAILYAYFVCFGLQVAIFFVGNSTNGSARWIKLPFVGRFQPSEVTKIVVILLVAYVVSKKPRRLDTFWGFFGIMVFVSILAALVLVENLSTALVILGISFIICFVASRKKLYYFLTAIFIGVGGVASIFTVGYRANRITQWLNVETEGYQILQGLYAICSGGWFGKGLGNSAQKLGYIPEVHTDMIFSIFCEELGILGVLILFLVYGLLLHRIYKIIINARDLFGSLLCVGVFAHFAIQIVLNVAVVTNTLPSTGVTLPFISYGGTSILSMLIEMGIVMSVSSHIEYEE